MTVSNLTDLSLVPGDMGLAATYCAIQGYTTAAALKAGASVRYALFSRSGFGPNLIDLARAERIPLYGLEELFDPQAAP